MSQTKGQKKPGKRTPASKERDFHTKLSNAIKDRNFSNMYCEAPSPLLPQVGALMSETFCGRSVINANLNKMQSLGFLDTDDMGEPTHAGLNEFVSSGLSGSLEGEINTDLFKFFHSVALAVEKVHNGDKTSKSCTLTSFLDPDIRKGSVPDQPSDQRNIVLGAGAYDRNWTHKKKNKHRPNTSKQRYYIHSIVSDPGQCYLNLPQVTTDRAKVLSWIDHKDLTADMTFVGSNVATVLPDDHPVHKATTVQVIPNLDFMVAQRSAEKVGDDRYLVKPALTFHSVIGGIESMRLKTYDFVYTLGESHVCYRFPKTLDFRPDTPYEWKRSETTHDFWTSSTIVAGNKGHLAELRKGPFEVVRKQDGVFICFRIINGDAYYYTRGDNNFFLAENVYPTDRDVLLRFEYVASRGNFFLLSCTIDGVVIPEINEIQRHVLDMLILPNLPVPVDGEDNSDTLAIFTEGAESKSDKPILLISVPIYHVDDHFEGIVVRPKDASTAYYFKSLEHASIDLDYSTLMAIARDRRYPYGVDISKAIIALQEKKISPDTVVQYRFDCTQHAVDLRSSGSNPTNCPIKARAIARLNNRAQKDNPDKPFSSAMVYKLVFDMVRVDKSKPDPKSKFATIVDVADLRELMKSL